MLECLACNFCSSVTMQSGFAYFRLIMEKITMVQGSLVEPTSFEMQYVLFVLSFSFLDFETCTLS